MTNKEHAWRDEELRLGDVREHPRFQVRVNGLVEPHVRVLERTFGAGGDVEPIRVAKVGKALYLVDGFHRMAAARRAGRATIGAKVARMSLGDAEDVARLANTKHGRSLSRADKAKMLEDYCAAGRHLNAHGATKSTRDIAGELNHVYSHETVRQRLKALGVEMDEEVEFPGGYRPMFPEPDEDALAAERAEEARGHLQDFASLFPTLDARVQEELLTIARQALGSLERGERPQGLDGATAHPLDI